MADEARTVMPVNFFDDPSRPLQGIRDFTPRSTQPEDSEDAPDKVVEGPRSTVYGGSNKPSAEQPVVMDTKDIAEVGDKAGEDADGAGTTPEDPAAPDVTVSDSSDSSRKESGQKPQNEASPAQGGSQSRKTEQQPSTTSSKQARKKAE